MAGPSHLGGDRADAGRAWQTVRLTLPDWSPRARAVLLSLGAAAGETRLVGGAVRDRLAGTPTADIDLATIHPPDEARRRIVAAGAKAIPTGLAHGTITAVFEDGRFEVTTLRRDVATDGRRAVVEFTRDWREDAARRDFTMNAIYADALTGETFDYHGGEADLAAGIVRFIGDPLERIAEDHLRILRFFRFHARFASGAPDPAAMAACTARANDLMALSRERVRDEMLKLVCAHGAVATLATMIAAGILAPVLPEVVDSGRLTRLVEREAALDMACVPLRRLAALLAGDATVVDAVAQRLRLSTAERRRLVAAATPAPDLDPDRLAYARGVEGARDALLLADAPPEPAALTRLGTWVRPRLPVGGGDLVAAGMPPGPAVAARLAAIEAAWARAGFPEAFDWQTIAI